MTVVQRRVFYGKVNTAGQLVELAKEMYGEISEHAGVHGVRILTDHQSGRTDRVVAEVEVDSLADMEASVEKTMTDPAMQEKFGSLMGRLGELIEYAEVEQWTVH